MVGLHSGYNHLTAEQKSRVVDFDGKAARLHADGRVYRVTVPQLQDVISKEKDVIVYEFIPFCRSENCVSPAFFEEYCQKKGYRYAIVSVMYDQLMDYHNLSQPLMVIDTRAYRTKLRTRYQRLFFDELTGTTQEARNYHSFHRFHQGKYVGTYGKCTDIE